MTTSSFGDIFAQAKASGAFDTTVPDGIFVLEIAKGNGKFKDNGEPTIGLHLKIVAVDPELGDDSDIGKGTWLNLHFSEKAAPISFRQLVQFGLTEEFIQATAEPQDVANALIGVRVLTDVGHRNWGKGGENVSNTFKIIELVTPPVVCDDADPSEGVVDAELVDEEVPY